MESTDKDATIEEQRIFVVGFCTFYISHFRRARRTWGRPAHPVKFRWLLIVAGQIRESFMAVGRNLVLDSSQLISGVVLLEPIKMAHGKCGH